MRRNAALLFVVTWILSACSPSAADPKVELIGRWESPTWKFGGGVLYVQFEQNGELTFRNDVSSSFGGQWLILDSGELQVTYPSGSSKRCKIAIDGKNLTVEKTACFYGWDTIEPGVVLVKR